MLALFFTNFRPGVNIVYLVTTRIQHIKSPIPTTFQHFKNQNISFLQVILILPPPFGKILYFNTSHTQHLKSHTPTTCDQVQTLNNFF